MPAYPAGVRLDTWTTHTTANNPNKRSSYAAPIVSAGYARGHLTVPAAEGFVEGFGAASATPLAISSATIVAVSRSIARLISRVP